MFVQLFNLLDHQAFDLSRLLHPLNNRASRLRCGFRLREAFDEFQLFHRKFLGIFAHNFAFFLNEVWLDYFVEPSCDS